MFPCLLYCVTQDCTFSWPPPNPAPPLHCIDIHSLHGSTHTSSNHTLTQFSVKPVRAGRTSLTKLSTVITPFPIPTPPTHKQHIVCVCVHTPNIACTDIHKYTNTLTNKTFKQAKRRYCTVVSENPFIIPSNRMSGCIFAVNTFIFPWMSDIYPGGGSFMESSWIQTNAKRTESCEISSTASPRFLPENVILQPRLQWYYLCQVQSQEHGLI